MFERLTAVERVQLAGRLPGKVVLPPDDAYETARLAGGAVPDGRIVSGFDIPPRAG